MRTVAQSLVALCCSAPVGAHQKPPEQPAAQARALLAASHGTLPWFAGSYEELCEKARRENRPVVVFLWTDGSRWCRRLESEALSDPKLAAAVAGTLAWNADANLGAGKMLSERLGAHACPLLIFFDDQGRALDCLDGYQAKEQFLTDVARVLRNEDTAPDLRRRVDAHQDDLELRTRYAYKLEALGDFAGRDAEIEQIRKRDRGATSLPLRRELYAERLAKIQEHFETTHEINPGPLVRFLEEERHPELLFQGYTALAAMHIQRAEELERAQQVQAARAKRADLRATLIKAAPFVPKNPAVQMDFAIETLSSFATHPAELSAADRAFLMNLCAGAVALDPDEARAQASAGMASFLNGDKPNAAIALRRARELEPDNPEWPELSRSLGL